jgi:hypothetical protein
MQFQAFRNINDILYKESSATVVAGWILAFPKCVRRSDRDWNNFLQNKEEVLMSQKKWNSLYKETSPTVVADSSSLLRICRKLQHNFHSAQPPQHSRYVAGYKNQITKWYYLIQVAETRETAENL